jgi:prolyl oligopeptidase
MKSIYRALPAILLVSFACSSSHVAPSVQSRSYSPNLDDSYQWLEQINGPKVVDWVAPHNKKSTEFLTQGKRYEKMVPEIRKIATAKDRIPYPAIYNGVYRNFWQDDQHVRGIWRETSPSEFAKKNPAWKTIFDLDALNKKEKKSWVWEGAQCLPPEYTDCVLMLSDGGKDGKVAREFDVSKGAFVDNGFVLPEGKLDVSWIDKDTVMVGTDFGTGTLTRSGYPRQVRVWKRGTPLSEASLAFEGRESDVSDQGYKSFRPESSYVFVQRAVSFFEEENFLYTDDGKLTRVPFPLSADFVGDFQGLLLAKLRKDWQTTKRKFIAGSLVSLPVSEITNRLYADSLELVYEPDSRSTLSGTSASKSYLFLNILKNVRGRILVAKHTPKGWALKSVPVPEDGLATVAGSSPFTDTVLVGYQNFTVPPTLYAMDVSPDTPQMSLKVLKKLPSRYDASGIQSEQLESTSRDGTKIPYFLIHKKGMKLDGTNPTLLYAYGGFEASQAPYYLGTTGKIWLEQGGVYALANIRGGGEFGPAWHEAALKENRQKAYDDFISVSEDLIARKITSPRHLGIRGGSNGGLLVGAAFTQRPDLYRAVICESALLDMIRYTKLPPGASWVGEYGDPADSKMAEIIARYSPYQNVRPGVKYPRVFFHISTADDRVQPGHTRKMVARMEEYGNDVLLFENTEGGHGGAADLEQGIKKTAMEYSYLFKELAD